MVNTADSYSDVIRYDVDDPSIEVSVTGNIKITVDPTFSDLTLESTLNSVDIGTCAAPTILLTNTCQGSDAQNITAFYTFNTVASSKDLTLTTVNLETGAMVNDVDWDATMAAIVSKTDEVSLTVSGDKTFDQAEFAVAAGIEVIFSNTVFGLSHEAPTKIRDMSYLGASNTAINGTDLFTPDMPDLDTALDNVITNSEAFPDQYYYMTPVYISQVDKQQTKSLAAFSGLTLTQTEWDDMPFHILTFVGPNDDGKLDLRLFKITGASGAISLEDMTTTINFGSTMDDIYPSISLYGEESLFGDLVTVVSSGVQFYVVLVRHEVETRFYVYKYESNALTLKSGASDNSARTGAWKDLELVRYNSDNCFVVCGDTSKIVCATMMYCL